MHDAHGAPVMKLQMKDVFCNEALMSLKLQPSSSSEQGEASLTDLTESLFCYLSSVKNQSNLNLSYVLLQQEVRIVMMGAF